MKAVVADQVPDHEDGAQRQQPEVVEPGYQVVLPKLDAHKGEPTMDEFVALKAWMKERVEDGSKILFPSQKGGAMTRMQLGRLFKQYALAAGVSEDLAHPHSLRHSLCSIMAEQHSDIYAIQRKAGHKNISNTMIYTHVSDRQADDASRSALMAAFA